MFPSFVAANLAAILTQQKNMVRVSSLNDAIKAGMRLCATRKNMEIVTELNGFESNFFVVDPISEG